MVEKEIDMAKKLIVLSSPSGGGKTTVAQHLLRTFPNMRFSISATTRSQREGEIHARDYFFLSKDDFGHLIKNDGLVEWEEIYGNYYGTLRNETENALNSEIFLLFDIDVKGAMSLRMEYPDDTLLIFLSPPDMKTIENRLRTRATESENQLKKRIERMKMEMEFKDKFDHVVVNKTLENTLAEVESIVMEHISE